MGLQLWGAVAAAEPSALAIGLLLPPDEPDAVALRKGVEIAVAHANAAGGPPARLVVRGRIGQWGADADEAARMVTEDGVGGLITPPGGSPSHLSLQVSGRTAVPVVSLCSDGSVTRAGIPWMVRVGPRTSEEAALVLRAPGRSAGAKALRWAALAPAGRAGREVANDLRQAAREAGAELVAVIPVAEPAAPPDERNHPAEAGRRQNNPIVQQVLAAQVTGALLWLGPREAGEFARALRAAGFEGQFAGSVRLRAAAFLAAAGPAAEGILIPGLVEGATTELRQRLTADYRGCCGGDPEIITILAFDATRLLIEVLREAGTHPAFLSFPLRHAFSGASGTLEFDRQGNRRIELELLVCHGGKFRLSDPPP